MTRLLKYRYTLSFGKNKYVFSKGDPELSMTRNCRVHCSIECPDDTWSASEVERKLLLINELVLKVECYQYVIS